MSCFLCLKEENERKMCFIDGSKYARIDQVEICLLLCFIDYPLSIDHSARVPDCAVPILGFVTVCHQSSSFKHNGHLNEDDKWWPLCWCNNFCNGNIIKS